ncbi:MAG: cell division protein FtsW [Candidatus Levybacteria bacterium RBG_16_35_6]|nr:MAG: cell division protein FtsW [Candidatus Levybacteria bacterium RBG_16_35_6]
MKRVIYFLIPLVCFLVFFGLLMIYDASSFVAYKDFSDKYHYLKEQSFWIVLGFCALAFFSFFNYKKLYHLALPFLLIVLFLLVLVFVPGLGVNVLGAKRWINLGFTVIQPSEFAKLALAIYLAAWFSGKEKARLPAFLLLLGLILFLVILQPDMGTTAIILAEGLVIYFLSGASLFYFTFLVPTLLFIGYILIKIAPYRAQRLASFLNFDNNPQMYSYHVKQILIGLGSGGLTGVGIGNSLQKYAYLPENTTDSIFAIIGEELGFLGAFFVIALFLFLIFMGFYIAMNAKDVFGRLLAGGITAFLGFQIFINIAAQTALLPLTGVPLPFISYGGSALIVNLAAIGILVNIARQKMKSLS